MPLIAQHGVILLSTLFASIGHLVGVVGLQVILQVVLPVECLLTVKTLMRFLWGVGGHVPHQFIFGNKGFATVCLHTLERPLPGVGVTVDSELLQGEEGLAT